MINFLSNSFILIFLFIVILWGLIENKNVFDYFIKGVIDGEKIVVDLFPILLGLVVSVGMLNSSGILNFFSNIFFNLFKFLKIEKELFPLILIRPISGSTTITIATSLMKKYGVDSKIGLISSCIMGSTETTIYVASIYSSKLKIKNIGDVIIIGLIIDFIGVLLSCLTFKLGFMKI